MSREILFRGKVAKVPKYLKDRMKVGDWVYGSYVSYPVAQIFDLEEEYIIDPATVGQYTGLCDKNGVKIFEGDILTTDLIRPYVIVVFRDGSFMFNCNDGDKDYYDIMLPIMKNVQTQTLYHKVIGNIHDNPELLKEEKQ